MICAQDVLFSYSRSNSFRLCCKLFRAHSGTVTSIVGPNASGKSTFLKILGGRIKSAFGDISYQGADIRALPKERLAKEIGWIDSTVVASLVPEMLVADHLALALLAGHQKIPFFHRTLRIENLIDQTRMSKDLAELIATLAPKRIVDLNSGARQALTIALALVNPRNIILADEGTATLDIKNARHFFASMQNLTRNAQVAVVAVTHDLMLAAKYSDSIYFVKGGVVEALDIGDDAKVNERISALEELFFDE